MAAALFGIDLIITIAAWKNADYYANAAGLTSSSLSSMRARAEAIINYRWTPAADVETWNNSRYNGKALFPAGKVVRGMPYTLFTDEIVGDSLLSLEQYSLVADVNYSVKAKCRAKDNAWRTGPVYGSCCATFVSEVLGGSFMSGSNPRYDSVSIIEGSSYAMHFTNAKASEIKAGDALSKTGHIIWVGDVTDTSYVIYEQTPPVAHKVIVSKSSAVNKNGYLVYKGKVYNTISRINVTGAEPDVSAPAARTAHQYYVQGAQADVSWDPVADASYYLVDVMKDGQPVVNSAQVTETSYVVGMGNGEYEVHVTAVSGLKKAVSDPVSFSIGRLDTPVIRTKEKYYASGDSIEVKWSSCAGASRYHVRVTGNGEVCCETDVHTTSYFFSPEDGYYELVVEAVNDNGGIQTASSEIYGFNVGDKRGIIMEPSAAYFACNADVTVSWNDCEGVSDYILDIRKNHQAYLSETVSGKTSFLLENLPDGCYEARVSAVESTGEYDWQTSEPLVFTVGRLEKPVIASLKKYWNPDESVTVRWNECEGATGYHVAVESSEGLLLDEDMTVTSCTFTAVEGRYSITVTSVNTNGGLQECVSDEAVIWASSLDLDKPSQLLRPGESVGFVPVVVSADPSDTVRWSVSDARVASVSRDGVVSAKGPGSVSLEARLGNLSVVRTIDVIPELSFRTLGASIRLSDPYGIRFGVRLEKDEAFRATDIIGYGTLLIASGTLGNNELTMDTPSCRKISAENLLENDDSHITYSGVLINIPTSFFGTDVVGRGYLIYRGADGKSYTLYSEAVVKSFNGVAQAAYDSYSAIENPNQSQQEALQKLKELLGL